MATRNSRSNHTAVSIRVLVLLLGALFAALLAACTEGSDRDPEPTEVIDISVTNDGIDPDGFRLLAPAEYRLAVRNESDEDCSFSLGGLVRLELAAGSRDSINFSTLDTSVNDSVAVGCGDHRSGTASIRQPGS